MSLLAALWERTRILMRGIPTSSSANVDEVLLLCLGTDLLNLRDFLHFWPGILRLALLVGILGLRLLRVPLGSGLIFLGLLHGIRLNESVSLSESMSTFFSGVESGSD